MTQTLYILPNLHPNITSGKWHPLRILPLLVPNRCISIWKPWHLIVWFFICHRGRFLKPPQSLILTGPNTTYITYFKEFSTWIYHQCILCCLNFIIFQCPPPRLIKNDSRLIWKIANSMPIALHNYYILYQIRYLLDKPYNGTYYVISRGHFDHVSN